MMRPMVLTYWAEIKYESKPHIRTAKVPDVGLLCLNEILINLAIKWLTFLLWNPILKVQEVGRMNSLVNAIKNTVPITQFNRGLAGKIFEDVKKQGAKVVMKNNTPECVLMSPEEYLSLMEEVEDAKLLRLAESRLQNFTPAETIPAEDVYQKYGITDADLADFDEVELE